MVQHCCIHWVTVAYLSMQLHPVKFAYWISKGSLNRENSASQLFGRISAGRRLMTKNEKAALSSQKTVNKQDEVIGTTACPALMMMAPLIGLQLTQPLQAPLLLHSTPFLCFFISNEMMFHCSIHHISFPEHCMKFQGKKS